MDHTLGGCFVYHAYRFTVHGLQIRIPCGNTASNFFKEVFKRDLIMRLRPARLSSTFTRFIADLMLGIFLHLPGINLTLSIVPWDEPHCK